MLKTILKLSITAFTSSILFISHLEAQCGRGFCDPDDDCDNNRIWIEAEYLYWQIKDTSKTVPLVTSGPTYNPILGAPDSTVVLGGKKIESDWRSGAKIGAGYWLDDERYLGVEASYFILPSQTKTRSVSSSGLVGSPFLSVPFFDATALTENAMPVSSSDPLQQGGPFSGVASYKLWNDVQGAELNGLLVLEDSCNWKLGLLAGFRYFNFDENFTFTTNSPYVDQPDNIFVTKDKFNIQNNFYGAQIGLDFDYASNGFFVDLQGKIALGANNGKIDIHGKLLTNDFLDSPSTEEPLHYAGGVFGLPSNIGGRERTFFTYIPEVNLNVGYQVMDWCRFKLGYSFLYVSKLYRATQQINRRITPAQSAAILFSPNVTVNENDSPRAIKRSQSMWAQGLNVGVEFNF